MYSGNTNLAERKKQYHRLKLKMQERAEELAHENEYPDLEGSEKQIKRGSK